MSIRPLAAIPKTYAIRPVNKIGLVIFGLRAYRLMLIRFPFGNPFAL